MFKTLKSWSSKALAVAGLGIASIGTASAALPAAVAAGFTSLLTDVLALVDLAWTVVVPVTIAFVLIGMFRRSVSAAT